MPDLSEADKNRYMEENAQAVKEQVILPMRWSSTP